MRFGIAALPTQGRLMRYTSKNGNTDLQGRGMSGHGFSCTTFAL